MVRSPLLHNQKLTDQDAYNAACKVMGTNPTIQIPDGVRVLLATNLNLTPKDLMQLVVIFGRSNKEIAVDICKHPMANEEVVEAVIDLYASADFAELILTLHTLGKLQPKIIAKINRWYSDAGLPNLV